MDSFPSKRRRYRRCLGAAFSTLAILLVVFAMPSLAYEDPLAMDVRAVGMGMTHVGVLGNPNPVSANPAAYGFDPGEVSLLCGAGFDRIAENRGSVFVAVRDVDRGVGAGGFAFTYQRPGNGDGEPGHGSMHVSYQVGKAVGDWLSLGIGLGYSSPGAAGNRTLTTDAGLILKLGGLSLGASASDISSTRLGSGEGPRNVFKPEVSVGAALRLLPGVTLAADVHNVLGGQDDSPGRWYSGGAEVWLWDKVAVRGGVMSTGVAEDAQLSYTGGLGLKAGKAEFGYAVMWDKSSVKGHYISVGASF